MNLETLRDKIVVVTGGTGNVGEGIVRAFLHAGATVVVPTRTEARVDELKSLIGSEFVGNIIGITGDTGSFEGMRAVAQRVVEEVGHVDHVVSALGGWWMGKPVWELSEAEFQKHFVGLTALQFSAARAFVPVMNDGGSYSFVVGLSAILAVPGASPMGMYGGAQLMLAKYLQAEVGNGLRVNSLMLGPVVTRGRPSGQPQWINADEVGDGAVRVALSNVRDTVVRLDDSNSARKTYKELGL